MANMFFAGIPLEGSGARPLDADLYGAEQQNVDQENLSATGNLNIGNVIRYDEHTQRYLNGGAKPGENFSLDGSPAAGDRAALANDSAPKNASLSDSFSPEAEQNFSMPLSNPQAQSRSSSLPQTSQAPGTPGTNGVSSTNTQSSSESHETIRTTGGEGTTNIFNTYNNNNQTTNNVSNSESHYTENNYGDFSLINAPHIVNIGDITIGGNGGGGGSLINVLNNLTVTENNFLSDISTTIVNNIGGDNNLLSNILNGNSIGDVNILNDIADLNILNDILNQSNLLDLSGNTLNIANDLLDVGGNTVNLLSNNLNNVLSGNQIGVAVNALTDVVDDVTVNIANIGDTVVGVALPAVGVVTNILDGNVIGVNSIIAPVVETAVGVTNVIAPVVETLVGVVENTQLNNVVSNVVSEVTNIVTAIGGGQPGDIPGILQPVVDTVLGAGGDLPVLGDILGGIGGPAPNPGDILSVLEPVVAPVGEILATAEATVMPTVDGIVAGTAGTVAPTLDALVHEANAALQPTLDNLAANLEPNTQPVVDVLDSTLAGLGLGGHPLLDANASLLGQAFGAADNNSLVNADAALLSHTDSTPQAMGLGLLDVDASLLSTPSNGAQDALSVSLNANALLPNAGLPVPNITVPLPQLSAVPLAEPIMDPVYELSSVVDSSTSSLLDPALALAALTSAASSIAAVDAGVLFAGGSAGAGAGAPVPVVHDLHIGNLLHAGLFGH